jgi:hypothetical protein
MAKGKFIVAVLSLLLLVFFCNDLPRNVSITCHTKGSSCLSSSERNSQKTVAKSPIFSKNVTKKDHVKVRFMGGECSFAVCPAPLFEVLPEFANDEVNICAYFLIPANEERLLSLRGPPAINLC